MPKENLKKDEDIQSLVGVWESDISKQERIKITIKKSAHINIENSNERNESFKIVSIIKQRYFDKEYSNDTLDYFTFSGINENDRFALNVNKMRDSLFLKFRQINNFYKDSIYLTILTRAK